LTNSVILHRTERSDQLLAIGVQQQEKHHVQMELSFHHQGEINGMIDQ